MIPYIDIPPVKIGPVEIYAFGVLVMVAILVGSRVAQYRAKGFGVEPQDVSRAVLWAVICGFLGAHLLDVFAYHPAKLAADPLLIFKINRGLSSFGGFLGAFIGIYAFTKVYKRSFRTIIDLLTLGFVAGWPFGRMGCSLAHDHPGLRSDFFLAVAYPGGARHDLGFYEMLFAIVIFFIFERVRRRERPHGSLILILIILYTPVRFLLDFLRLEDTRYSGLTPAQILSVCLFIGAIFLYMRLGKGNVSVGTIKKHPRGKKQRKKHGKRRS